MHYFDFIKTIIPIKKIEETNYKSFNNVLMDLIEEQKKNFVLFEPYEINPDKAFIISPVRSTDDSLVAEMRAYKEFLLEDKIFTSVHYPFDDTDQSDPRGIKICRTNMEAEATSGTILILYKKDSFGSIFDLGMDFTFKYYFDKKYEAKIIRKFNLLNPENVKGNEYEKFLLDLVKNEK